MDALVALMSDDVWVRMPPLPFEYHGTAAAHRLFTAIDAHRRQIIRLVAVRASRQPAWGEYVRDPHTAGLRLVGVLVRQPCRRPLPRDHPLETALAAHLGLPPTL